jgi:NTP pyrophosphatase (non-canonical NTP hydrolase)
MNIEDLPISQTYVARANELDSAGKDSTMAWSRIIERDIPPRMFQIMSNVIEAATDMDHLKKFIFYGKEIQVLLPHCDVPFERSHIGSLMTHNTIRLLHSILGLITESGELCEQLFAHLFGGADLNWDNIKEEYGDTLWYNAIGAKACDITTLDEFMLGNIAKLEKRYGGTTWNQEGALNRDTKAEIVEMKQAMDNEVCVVPVNKELGERMKARIKWDDTVASDPIKDIQEAQAKLHPEVASQMDPKTVAWIEQDRPSTTRTPESLITELHVMVIREAGTEKGTQIVNSPVFREIADRLKS